MKFLSYDSPFSQLLLKLCYNCYLNLLWLLCCIPIVTIGASTTALYYTSLKIVRGEDHSLAHTFFRSYYNRFTVRGTAASRVFFRIIAKAVRMGGHWPDVQLQGLTRPIESQSASLSFAAFDLCR